MLAAAAKHLSKEGRSHCDMNITTITTNNQTAKTAPKNIPLLMP